MDEQRQPRMLAPSAAGWLLLALVLGSGTLGCVGPQAVRYTRLRYNDVVRDTNDQQLLLNIVRLRYADSPVFIDLPNITSQFELAGGGSYVGPNQSVSGLFGYGGLNGRDTPTISYHPREGREIAKSLLTPLSADLFSVVNAGADIEQLLLMTVNDLNDVPNATRATLLTPRVPDDNSQFLRGIQIFEALRERDATELGVDTKEAPEGSSDPVPLDKIQALDLLNAARDGYIYRIQREGEVTLRKREKELVLKVRPAYINSPEMQEVARIFHLTPGLSSYRVKSELTEEADRRLPNPLGNDTLYMNLRSISQVMTFLSKGVCIPEEHIVSGVAPMTPGPDGTFFDWTQVTAGDFCVHVQKHRPHDAEVAVSYRDYWFYIARNDVRSRATLAILEILFALQESDGKSIGPLLTLPLGG